MTWGLGDRGAGGPRPPPQVGKTCRFERQLIIMLLCCGNFLYQVWPASPHFSDLVGGLEFLILSNCKHVTWQCWAVVLYHLNSCFGLNAFDLPNKTILDILEV